jgi:serine/threonine-protein kinase
VNGFDLVVGQERQSRAGDVVHETRLRSVIISRSRVEVNCGIVTRRLPRFSAGDVFADRYVIVEDIGAGGMGEVYKARDRVLGHTVALKLLRPEIAAGGVGVERFKREIHLARQVTHGNVCRMHDIGEIDGLRYISMEHVDGQTLHDLIQSMGRLSPRQTVGLARQIALGLEAIHRNGIVHRDLKPTNIMLDRSGRAVLMDFGLALAHDQDKITSEGEVLGTLSYLSPEQAHGSAVDARSDLFAFGLILFEMLTGVRPPGDGERVPLALRKNPACPPPSSLTPEVPKELDAIVLRCLDPSPLRRYSSALELDEALGRVSDFSSSSAMEKTKTPRSGKRVVLGLAAIASAFVAALVALKPDTPRAASLAILPLSYEGPQDMDYLASLVPLFLGDELRESRSLEVAPFASSRSFSPGEPARSVGSELGVDYVVRGELSFSSGRLRSAIALEGIDGEREWAGELETEVSSVQEELVRIASGLRGAIGVRAEPSRLGRKRTAAALGHYTRGMIHLEGWDVDRNHDRAARAFRDALSEDPDFPEAKAGLSMALWAGYLETRDPSLVREAESEARSAVETSPSLPEAHLAMGVVALGQGRSVEAEASLARAQELAPGNDDVSRRIAAAYDALGREDEAEAMYERAIALRPSYWRHVNDLGAFYLHRGRIDEAKIRFREVIRLSPERHTGYANLAGAHLLAGEIEEAEPLLQAAIRIHPSDSAHNNLGFVYYSTGRFEEAAEQYEEAIRLAPEDAMYRGNLGDAYRQLGRAADADRQYESAIDRERAVLAVNPEDTDARAGLGMFLAGAGRCDDARQETERALAGAHEDPTVFYYAAIAHAVCGNGEEALKAAASAVRGGVVADVRTNPDLKPLLGREPLASLLR